MEHHISIHLHKKHIVYGIVALFIIGLGVGAFFTYRHVEYLKKEIADLQIKNYKLSQEIEDKNTEISKIKDEKLASQAAGKFVAQVSEFWKAKLIELDNLTTKNDKNSNTMISWFYDNCNFYNEELPLASSKYTQWSSKKDGIIDEYEKLTNEITAFVDKMETFLSGEIS